MDKIIIQDLLIQAVIGVNPGERVIKQNIIITVTAYKDLSKCGSSDNVNDTVSYSSLSKSICSYSESSHHYTLEALATGVAKICCLGFGIERVKVLIQKPGAIKLAKWPGVQIERTLDYFKSNSFVEIPSKLTNNNRNISSSNNGNNIVYLAFGSNLGDKFQNILNSFKRLEKQCFIQSTSFMYESSPQYYREQDSFFNCACKVSTDLKPQDLLKFIKQIEADMGRVETFRNGPRVIDIDIIYYNNLIIKTDDLEIPHPLMWERDFVLLPLSDIAPNFIHPTLHITTNRLKLNLPNGGNIHNISTSLNPNANIIEKVNRIGNFNYNWNEKTFIMGILNVTPDSFVDGGKFNTVETSIQQAKNLVQQGADIIDIGGQSTYPGAPQISIEEEINRVVPTIKKIREIMGNDIPLSIDTLHHQVAKEAILAGCNIINDVSGGMTDPEMLLIAKEFRVPIILNHSQPTTQYLQQKQNEQLSLNNSSNSSINDDENNRSTKQLIDLSSPSVITTLNSFFKERIETCTKLGLFRWQIILDPGLGFYKTYEQSIEILQRGKELMGLGFPMLIGPSRKGFIANTIAQGEKDKSLPPPSPKSERRLWGTIACCCIGSTWGANIIRVHDIPEIRDAMLISDSVNKPQRRQQIKK
ncbi:hypothetical protein RB653_004669 [Dictyostelium firmibasis]|uniref:Folic acid synthesis protein FOL1 n=1 Tax=Dictyostelium firmibasis TaxID=79012 RepID=A0AAN7U010_9MYCE